MVLLLLWIFMLRQMQNGGNKALSFGKSRARLHSTQQKKVTFKDVAGCDEAKEEVWEVVEFLKDPLNDLCISRPRERLEWGARITPAARWTWKSCARGGCRC